MVQVEITGVTGTAPYDIYVCDPSFIQCELVTSGVTIPPTYSFTLTGTFETFTSFIVKVVDSLGCEVFNLYNCEPLSTPTQTPTITPTITPTTTPGCRCIEFFNTSAVTLNIGYTQCNNTTFFGVINPNTYLYYCGSNPFADQGVNITISEICTEFSCIPPTKTPTSTPTPTLTPGLSPTPTPTVTPTITPTQLELVFRSCCDFSTFVLTGFDLDICLGETYYIETLGPTGFTGCTEVVYGYPQNFYNYFNILR
ncbi:hypothetical protein EBZ38_11470, partial [bacterium]|nr:hypothetical protein [bacterium]